jgi:uncharacterized protein (TIGR02172 family)
MAMAQTLTYNINNGTLTVCLNGRVDASNAAETEKQLSAACAAAPEAAVVLDAEKLEYISSAGLRILLRLRKAKPGLEITNVSPEVYDILDMTGFTEMMTVKKAYRQLSVDGCELIGKGANGAVYRYDAETIIKVYFNPDSLPEIQRERELARKALVLGINTAIPYDVVRVGDCYGTVMELLEAVPLSRLIRDNAEHLELPLKYYIDMLRQIHSTELSPGEIPDMKQVALGWAEFDREHLPDGLGDKLYAMVQAVPDRHTMMHGDFHPNNIMVRDGEALLIDMDTLCMGHPIFELGSMANAFIGFHELAPGSVQDFLGFSYELAVKFWHRTLAMYLETEDEARINEVDTKARIVGYMRLLRRTIRRNEPNREENIEYYRQQLTRLIPTVDELTF